MKAEKLNDELKDLIIELNKEFDEKDGLVTCELAIHKSNLDTFEKLVNENKSQLGKWVINGCNACVAYHGYGFLHASLELPSTVEKMEASDNHVKTFS